MKSSIQENFESLLQELYELTGSRVETIVDLRNVLRKQAYLFEQKKITYKELNKTSQLAGKINAIFRKEIKKAKPPEFLIDFMFEDE